METLGTRLKALRGARTGSEIANKVGITQPYYSELERGCKKPSVHILKLLADAFSVPVSYLMGEMDSPMSQEVEAYARMFEDVILVPVVGENVAICTEAGNSCPNVEWEVVDHYPVPSVSLKEYSWQGTQYKIIDIKGDSMMPLINDGGKVLFAENITRENSSINVVSWHGKLIVRGIRLGKNGVTLVPMNKAYPEINVMDDDEHFFVLGRVLKAFEERNIRGIF